jgi:ABC-2 type transport system permease protein
VATIQGAFPLLLMPLIGANIALWRVALGLLVLFVAGFAITAVGVVIASRLRSLESFGAISNGVIQPLFFLSGAIFPLGASVVVGEGEAFWMRVPMAIEWLMRINPIAYMLDVLRFTLYGQSYLPLALDTTVVLLLPPVALWFAVIAHRNILRGDRVAHRASMDA